MSAYFLLFTVVLCIVETLSCSCPNAWTVFGNSCYFSGHDGMSFIDAERFCQHRNGHLVHIENAAENAFIKNYLGNLKADKHWIGLTDQDIEGVWQLYDTDTIASYINWAPGEPNQGRLANCGAIWGEFGNDWVDNNCGEFYMPLCEKPCVTDACAIIG